MKKLLLTFAAAAVAVSTSFAVEGTNSPYSDPIGASTPASPTPEALLTSSGWK
jgi:hypothetical protein